MADHRPSDSLAMPLETISAQLSGWNLASVESLPPSELERLRPSTYILRTYQKHRGRLGLFIAYYAHQRAGETMHSPKVCSPKVCLPGAGWESVDQGVIPLTVNHSIVFINWDYVQKSGQRLLVLYWYQSRERIIARNLLKNPG